MILVLFIRIIQTYPFRSCYQNQLNENVTANSYKCKNQQFKISGEILTLIESFNDVSLKCRGLRDVLKPSKI